MGENIICAEERVEKSNKVRKQGFIPGVIYGKGIKSTDIKLDQNELRNLLRHTKKTNVKIKLGNEIRHCILREIQKDPVTGQVIHVALQAIHGDEVIRLKVPVIFQGKEKLSPGLQMQQERIAEVEVTGKAADMPEYVCVNVEGRKLGDKITVKDIQVPDGIKITDDESEILAVIAALNEYNKAS